MKLLQIKHNYTIKKLYAFFETTLYEPLNSGIKAMQRGYYEIVLVNTPSMVYAVEALGGSFKV
jgi:hypothetical protein